MKKGILISVIISLFWLSCGSDEATTESPQTGTISGNVYDAGTALPIAASNVSSNPPTSAVTTDTTGFYRITNVSPETYDVSAIKTGYYSGSVKIAVTAGNTTTADIFLIKDTSTVNF